MQAKTFGKSGTEIPVLGLGCARIGSFSEAASIKESVHLLDRALELGVTFFDTADVYGQGDSEKAIGIALRGRRDAGFILTKAGIRFPPGMRWMRPLKPLVRPLVSAIPLGRRGMTSMRQRVVDYDFSHATITKALEASLRRLRTEMVDAFLLHDAPPDVIQDCDTIEMLSRFRREGKVKAYGVSCNSVESVAAAIQMPGLELIEITCDMLDVLTKEDHRLMQTRRLGVIVREVLRNSRALPAALAIQNAVIRRDVTCAVVGTTSIPHLEELAAAIGSISRGTLANSVSARKAT